MDPGNKKTDSKQWLQDVAAFRIALGLGLYVSTAATNSSNDTSF